MHVPLLLLSILVGDIYLSPIKTQQICKRIKKDKKKRRKKFQRTQIIIRQWHWKIVKNNTWKWNGKDERKVLLNKWLKYI